MANLPEIIKDEIALEGLDGITLKALWQRIKNRSPHSFCESSKICNLSWDYIKSQPCFDFYTIPVPRDESKFDLTSLKSDNSECLYKLNIIDKNGILGSCEDYSTRKSISRTKVLHPLTYEQVVAEYGNQLVIVADQKTRFQTLIPSNVYVPPGALQTVDYIILERIGRSRQIGERSVGKNSLIDIVPDPRSMYHRRETLRKMGLICIDKDAVSINSLLPRFRKEATPILRDVVKTRLVDEASECKDGMMLSTRAMEIFNEVMQGDTTFNWKSFRKTSPMVNNFTFVRVPQWCPRKKRDISVGYFKLKTVKVASDDEKDVEDKNKTGPEFLNTSGQYYRVSVEKQIIITVEEMGMTGTTISELSQILGFSKPIIRNSVRGLVRSNVFFEEKRQIKSALVTFIISSRLKEEMLANQVQTEVSGKPKGVKRPIEEPLEVELVDVYGVPTKIRVEHYRPPGKTLKIDTDNRKKRINLALDMVRRMGITCNVHTLNSKISAVEGGVICRKTTQRLIQNLVEQGLVNSYRATLTRQNVTKMTQIICDAQEYNMRNEKFSDHLKILHKKMVPVVNMKLEALPKRKLDRKMKFQEKRFLNFTMLKPLHKFLMYVSRFWTTEDPKEDRTIPLNKIPVEWKESLKEGEILPPVYSTEELDWRTFIRPRFQRKDPKRSTTGWITIRELCDCMPLQLVHDLYKPIENAPNVPDYLNHPIKKFYMMNQCPTSALTRHSWFIEHFVLNLHKLCFLGLLKFGTATPYKKVEVPVYLNAKRIVIDTATPEFIRELPEGMPRITYEFTEPEVLDKFWDDLTTICLNTKIPRHHSIGYKATAKELAKWLTPIPMEDGAKLDDGSTPGDGKGAAGTHCGMTIHSYYYWDRVYKPDQRRIKPSRKPAVIATKPVVKKKQRVYKHVFDEVDVYARGATGLRSKWSSLEDTALLLARLANIYLSNTRGNLQLVSCVTYRDVLHWMCQSLDKSAKMCSRRVQFLCKNEVTKNTIEMCLKEMSTTKAVTSRFGSDFLVKLKEAYPSEEEYYSAVKINFVELVRILSGIYSKLTSTSFTKRAGSILPDTPEKFLEKYELVLGEEEKAAEWAKDLKHEDQIKLHTVYNVIHSSMCCAEDNFSYNLILLDIYKNFSEHVLSCAMEQARQSQLITRFKINHSQSRKTIPLNTRPFHLSNFYTRKFIINWNYEILERVHGWIEEARRGRDEFTNVDRSFAFVFLGLYARNAINVEASVPTDVRKGHLMRIERNESVVEEGEEVVEPLEKKWKPAKTVTFKEEVDIHDFDYEPTETMLKVNMLNWHIFCFLKEMIAAKDMTGTTSKVIKIDNNGQCNFACFVGQVKEFEEIEDLLAKINVRDFKVGIARIQKDLKDAKEKLVPENKKDLGKIADLKRIKIKYVLLLDDLSRDTFDPLVRRVTEIQLKPDVLFPRNPDKELINGRLIRWGHIEKPTLTIENLFENAEEANSLLDFIHDYEKDGAPAKDILEFYKDVSKVEGILLTLLDHHWVLLCGAGEVRFVHKDFKAPWIVNSCQYEEHEMMDDGDDTSSRLYLQKRPSTSLLSSPKQAKVLFHDDKVSSQVENKKRKTITLKIFPWIRVTGTINQRVVDKVIGTILLFLQGKTGMQLQQLFKKFSCFHESHLIVILNTMKDIELITAHKLKASKASLWSEYENPEIEPASLLLDSPAEIFIEPTMDSVLRYCEIRGNCGYRKSYC